jgi:hypothetical protein
MTTGHLLSY